MDYRELVGVARRRRRGHLRDHRRPPRDRDRGGRAGKHVIVEKPLTGCFGEAAAPRDCACSRPRSANADAVLEACRRKPASRSATRRISSTRRRVAKLRRLAERERRGVPRAARRGEPLRFARGLCPPLGDRRRRLAPADGLAPGGRGLHLKHWEGQRRHGAPIRVRSVFADVASLTRPAAFRAEPRSDWSTRADVEDWSVAILTFEDGTKATVHSNDISWAASGTSSPPT